MNLYHYCSAEAFFNIIKNKSIWLSSLSLSNDSMEGRLVAEILLGMAREDNLKEQHIAKLRKELDFLYESFDALGFCLSTEADLLGQWRGYANNASGFSIGFSEEILQELITMKDGFVVEIFDVVYEMSEQRKRLRPIYDEICTEIDKGAFYHDGESIIRKKHKDNDEYDEFTPEEALNDFYGTLGEVIPYMFSLKDLSFREEHEKRLLTHYIRKENKGYDFRLSNNTIVPYRQLSISNCSRFIIDDVVLGPKNRTPKHLVQAFLAHNGFDNAKVRLSDITYR